MIIALKKIKQGCVYNVCLIGVGWVMGLNLVANEALLGNMIL